jgi:hypothetical protein
MLSTRVPDQISHKNALNLLGCWREWRKVVVLLVDSASDNPEQSGIDVLLDIETVKRDVKKLPQVASSIYASLMHGLKGKSPIESRALHTRHLSATGRTLNRHWKDRGTDVDRLSRDLSHYGIRNWHTFEGK